MTIILKRTIHPVGQGAFYNECFYKEECRVPEVNVFYDCGSDTTKSGIKTAQLDVNKDVDYFFLSHFHSDHFNGNEKFFNDSLKIEKLIMPQLSVEEAIYCLLLCNPNCKKAVKTLCALFSNPWSVAKQVFVVERIQDSPNNPFSPLTYSIGNNGPFTIHSFDEIPIRVNEKPIWKYVPVFHNSIDSSEVSKAISRLKNDPLFSGHTKTPEQMLKHLIYLLQNKYKSARHLLTGFSNGSQNDFSMMVVSVPAKNDDENDEHLKPGALFTGDIPMNKVRSTIGSILTRFGHLLGTYQVPHHGSRHNFISGCFPTNEIHFLSAGIKNRYGHPTATFTGLSKLYIVTEDVKTKFTMNFKI